MNLVIELWRFMRVRKKFWLTIFLVMLLLGGLLILAKGSAIAPFNLHPVLGGRAMKVLGISAYYHDSAAALVSDGEIVAAAQEERFTRKKHDPVSRRTRWTTASRKAAPRSTMSTTSRSTTSRCSSSSGCWKPISPSRRAVSSRSACRSPSGCREAFPQGLLTKELRTRGTRKDVGGTHAVLEHHLSHAASAFFASPFEEAAVLTNGRRGRVGNDLAGARQGQHPRSLARDPFPAFARPALLGVYLLHRFQVNSGEYKVMGLAPYGEPRFVPQILEH